jgi:uncharacterized membrane protein YidH (DUF202 family)
MQRIEIDRNKKLNPGDVVELEFKTIGEVWFPAAQIAMIEGALANRMDWVIIRNSLPADGRITFTVLIRKYEPEGSWLQPAEMGSMQTSLVFTTIAVTAATIGASICAVGMVTWLVLDKVYQIVEESEVAAVGIGAAGIALLIYVLIQFWK